MEVSGQAHTSISLPLQKEPQVPIEYKTDLDVLEKR
jgi:hypothetical protein